MNELEKRMEKLEGLAERRNQEGQAVFKEGELMVSKETEERVRSLEISVERQERKVRRKNIIVKGVEMQRNKEWSQEVERIWEKIGVEGGKRNMRKIGGIDKEGKSLVLIEMEGLEKKREVMMAKSKLKGEKVRIEDDLTREERRIQRLIMEEARKERENGKRVKVGYMKMWVNDELRLWNESGEGWKMEEGNG
ncbi:Protein of unknown function [Cotesia congregata]|uniref:Uncharacterized protein n=1 Tax=Cotesia congregata TaxID=51543 RepID=A0A8J2HIH1_COTCN|nr:Protein of unknown function [Cotesia congregata]